VRRGVANGDRQAAAIRRKRGTGVLGGAAHRAEILARAVEPDQVGVGGAAPRPVNEHSIVGDREGLDTLHDGHGVAAQFAALWVERPRHQHAAPQIQDVSRRSVNGGRIRRKQCSVRLAIDRRQMNA
jgi:hypothetical protein